MAKVFTDEGNVAIPNWVVDLPTFRRWAESDHFPEEGRIAFINGEVWADMTMEQVYSHLRAKSELNMVVGGILKSTGLGLYLPDGLRFSNEEAGLSTIPDGTVLLFESIRASKVRLVQGKEGGYVSVSGSPDLIIEVVSDSSEDKDAEWLMSGFWEAGVREYWLIDARTERIRFVVLKRGSKGFAATRKTGGWLKSGILERAFRFRQEVNALGHRDLALEVR